MCDCIHMVDRMLSERNGVLETNWLSDPSRAMVSVCKRVSKGKKPPLMAATFCPFCGTEYEKKKRELARMAEVQS